VQPGNVQLKETGGGGENINISTVWISGVTIRSLRGIRYRRYQERKGWGGRRGDLFPSSQKGSKEGEKRRKGHLGVLANIHRKLGETRRRKRKCKTRPLFPRGDKGERKRIQPPLRSDTHTSDL